MSLARIAGLYALFGAVAIALNLATQRAVHLLAPEAALDQAGLVYWGALFAGTGVGLVAKYVLDKRWIFDDRSTGVAAHGRRFTLYTLMGVFTTVVFWGTQTLFFFIWQTETMLYVGGALGLTVGYVLKFNLDKRYVFTGLDARPG